MESMVCSMMRPNDSMALLPTSMLIWPSYLYVMKRVSFQLSFTLISLLVLCVNSQGQERIDSTLNFQTNPAKQFSIYIPSTYEAETPAKLMLGLHPLNVNRWNSVSWCDTLLAFAEANNLLLLCPDGGVDGKVDDPIDVDFTSFLLEEIQTWYSIDTNKIFATGFSWGGRTTYSYGLANPETFAGLMPIGAAVTGTEQVDNVLINAADEPIYVIHGSSDSPNTRYYPILEAIENNGAIVNTLLMDGVGHTIDFPNRNSTLTDGFLWLDSVSTAQNPIDTITVDPVDTMNVGIYESSLDELNLYPNPVVRGQKLLVNHPIDGEILIRIYDLNGALIYQEPFIEQEIHVKENWKTGIYLLVLKDGKQLKQVKFILQ